MNQRSNPHRSVAPWNYPKTLHNECNNAQECQALSCKHMECVEKGFADTFAIWKSCTVKVGNGTGILSRNQKLCSAWSDCFLMCGEVSDREKYNTAFWVCCNMSTTRPELVTANVLIHFFARSLNRSPVLAGNAVRTPVSPAFMSQSDRSSLHYVVFWAFWRILVPVRCDPRFKNFWAICWSVHTRVASQCWNTRRFNRQYGKP